MMKGRPFRDDTVLGCGSEIKFFDGGDFWIYGFPGALDVLDCRCNPLPSLRAVRFSSLCA